jgi:aminopeptidase N
MQDKEAYLRNPKNKEKNLIRYDYSDKEQMFDAVTYQKGGQILHMLRKVIGDDAFFRSLKLYLTRYSYKTVEVNDLRLAFEEITGQDLNWFFNEWFLASGHPVLKIETGYNSDTKLASVTIEQQGNIYKIPMKVDIYANNKVHREEIVLDNQTQNFTFPTATEPELINVDAEKSILAEKLELKPLEQYIFQYQNSPLFMDRFEVINKLEDFKKEKSARELAIKALEDKNWYIRKKALEFIPSLDAEEKTQVYEKVKIMALTDGKSLVRATAVTILQKVFTDKNNTEVFKKTAEDKAPSVQQATLNEKS